MFTGVELRTHAMWKWGETKIAPLGWCLELHCEVSVISATGNQRREDDRTHEVVLYIVTWGESAEVLNDPDWPDWLLFPEAFYSCKQCLDSIQIFVLGRREIWQGFLPKDNDIALSLPFGQSTLHTQLAEWNYAISPAPLEGLHNSCVFLFYFPLFLSFCLDKQVPRRVPEMPLVFNKDLLNEWTLPSSNL